AIVCGHDILARPLLAKRQIGYLPEGAPAYPDMTPAEFLDFIADVRKVPGDARRARLDFVIEHLSLAGVLGQSIETLSKGFRRRVGLAQAILHDPQVLILDEPTDGLDPNQKHEVRTLINTMAKDRTIVVSTHILEEVHAVCTRAIIIARGRILADATPDELEARSRYHSAVSLTAPNVAAAREALARIPEVESVEVDPQDMRITAFPRKGHAIFTPVSETLRAQGIEVSEIQLERGRLDEVFRAVTEARDATEARA
ncbi:MAG TPA: ATP-binding cassette domain-containing protein, partial [Candidatus Saccharimonadia bacterium]|nr:ATP-binding cassette domain-containing protein [Candidatus Saccharimonadia bacterium]